MEEIAERERERERIQLYVVCNVHCDPPSETAQAKLSWKLAILFD